MSAYRTYLAEYPDDQAAWFRLGWTYLAGVRPARAGGGGVQAVHRPQSAPNASSYREPRDGVFSRFGTMTRRSKQYRRAFDLNPTLQTDLIINHEYGFVLVRLGDRRRRRGAVLADAGREVERRPGARSPLARVARDLSRALQRRHRSLPPGGGHQPHQQLAGERVSRSLVPGADVSGQRHGPAVWRGARRGAQARRRVDAGAGMAQPSGQGGGSGGTVRSGARDSRL